jgi:hypothetical protein
MTADAHSRVRTLLATPPPAGRWTIRALATAIGISRASVHRVLKAGKFALVDASDRSTTTRASRAQHGTSSGSVLN